MLVPALVTQLARPFLEVLAENVECQIETFLVSAEIVEGHSENCEKESSRASTTKFGD